MANIFKLKLFWTFALAVTAAAFLFGLNSSKSYQAETRVLVVAKSEKTSRNLEQIMATAKQIPASLSFYDEVLASNQDIEDEAAPLPQNKRKEFWNSKLKISRVGKSTILVLKNMDADILNAELLSRETAKHLAIVMSRYYNIKNDLDVRIIDGPIVNEKNAYFDLARILKSLILGIIAGIILFLIYTGLGNIQFEKKISMTSIKSKPFQWPETKTIEKSKKEIKSEANVFFEEPVKKMQTVNKKGAAPDNLPVGSDFIIQAMEKTKDIQVEEEIKQEKKILSHEPTPREVKERLNKLLRGEM